jgi:transcriptional regulator with GAF, ATPase, and Fis domain
MILLAALLCNYGRSKCLIDVGTEGFLVQVARQIAIAVENSLSYRELSGIKERLATEKLYLEDEIRLDHNNGNMVGQGAAFQSILNSIQIVAPTDATVLILGETGTGKELVARAIHELSGRRKGSFVKVNCAAIPASLLESELFGHEKGSFTGAVAQKVGRFELAHGGTLFLDEIGEMPLELQVHILRLIQERELEKIGASAPIKVDVRIIAATHRDLANMAKEGTFRDDLYYRLLVVPIRMPSLRERLGDIEQLAQFFFVKFRARHGRLELTMKPEVLRYLCEYSWPGNVRQLENAMERMVLLARGTELCASDVPDFLLQPEQLPQATTPAPPPEQGIGILHAFEKQVILQALRQCGGNQTITARHLGISRRTLAYRLEKYGFQGDTLKALKHGAA